MKITSENTSKDRREERIDIGFDFWCDEGAKRYNEVLDEGSAYISAGVRVSEGFEAYCDEEPREYADPELYDPDEETLPAGEMELIFENSYIM